MSGKGSSFRKITEVNSSREKIKEHVVHQLNSGKKFDIEKAQREAEQIYKEEKRLNSKGRFSSPGKSPKKSKVMNDMMSHPITSDEREVGAISPAHLKGKDDHS